MTRAGRQPVELHCEPDGLVGYIVERRYVVRGTAVRLRRKELGLSLRELGKRVGVSAPFLCDIEAGYRQPSEEVRARLLKALRRP